MSNLTWTTKKPRLDEDEHGNKWVKTWLGLVIKQGMLLVVWRL